jgi:hypothetical protein
VPTNTTWQQDRGLLARKSKDLPAKHPELIELRRELRTKRLAEYIERVITEAPPLTDEQRCRLAELLRPVRRLGGDAA